MKKITITKSWDFVSPEKTVSYTPGEHEVTNEIADAADAAGVTGKAGDGAADKPHKVG